MVQTATGRFDCHKECNIATSPIHRTSSLQVRRRGAQVDAQILDVRLDQFAFDGGLVQSLRRFKPARSVGVLKGKLKSITYLKS